MKFIIFDFDGVIHDTFELAYKINVEVLGNCLTREDYRDFFNGNIYDHVKVTKKNSEKYFKLQNKLFESLKIEENVKKNLMKLAEKYTLFIISSNQKKALDIYFQNNNFINVFKEVLGQEAHKSKVEKFKLLFDKYGFDSENCIFVTDTLGDILEANKIDVKSIAVDFGFHGRDRLEKGNPFRIVSTFNEILETVENM